MHFFCNLSEVNLNLLNPLDLKQQQDALRASTLLVGGLLHHKFNNPKQQYSREVDPIVAVCLTGITDFFVNAFGSGWLRWWQSNRDPNWSDLYTKDLDSLEKIATLFNDNIWLKADAVIYTELERRYFQLWKNTVKEQLIEYCTQHNLRVPSRYTSVQPSGTKSLLTGASPGVHFHKGNRFIRRITFRAYDPVALACKDYGYNVIPSSNCKDENGIILTDIYDRRSTEWLVEIPCEIPYADLCDELNLDISSFSFKAQYDFYMQVQNYWTGHNCFSRDTEFLTDLGIKTFKNFKPGDVVTVLNANGNWVESPVVQTNDLRTMYEITLQQGKTKKIKKIVATGCHRFPVKRVSGGNCSPTIKTTVELKPGHRFVTNAADLFSLDIEGIQHGIVFGDGSKYKSWGSPHKYSGSQVYLCGAKRELAQYFLTNPDANIIERDDIHQTRIYRLPSNYKELPNTECSQEYLAGFFAGLLATDGSIYKSDVTISSSNTELVEFLNQQLPRLGIIVSRLYWTEDSGYDNSEPTCQIGFTKETIGENLILRTEHLEEFEKYESRPCQWKVVSVIELPEQQYGWCVMEPETNHFTLSQNILVMNTSVTFEYTQDEIPEVTDIVYEGIKNKNGFVSGAMMARFNDFQSHPLLPFEPISKEQYLSEINKVQERQVSNDFQTLMDKYFAVEQESYSTSCDGQLCELKGI